MNTLEPLASTLLILASLFTLGYIAQCVRWPYRPCRHCGGFGQFTGPFGGIRLCRRCQGSGLRLRVGRRVWNALHRRSGNGGK